MLKLKIDIKIKNLNKDNNKWFDNRTGIYIPQEVIDVFSLGEKFSLKMKKVSKNDVFEVIKCLENNLFKINENHHDQIRIDLLNIIHNTSNNQKKMKHVNHFDKKLNEKIEKTNKYLRDNKNCLLKQIREV